MIAEFIIFMAIGILCIVLGLILWRKQKISLVHDYHYRKVKKDDIPAYTRLIGIGLLLIGGGCCLSGIINIVFRTEAGWIAFAAGFVSGIILMHKAQKTFNGSWFS